MIADPSAPFARPDQAALFASRLPDLEHLARRIRAAGWRAPLLDGQLKTALEQSAYERLLRAKAGFPADLPLSQLRYGHESCEHLLPTPAMWTKAVRLAKRLGLGFSAVLPPTYASREAEVLAVLTRLDALASELGEPIEVTAADWGTVALIQEWAGLAPSLGRVMNRMKRFERWTRQRPTANTSGLEAPKADEILKAQVSMFQTSPLETPESRALGAEARVARHEYDPVPQGIAAPTVVDANMPLIPVALHVPWTYVTQGRRCVTRALIEGPGVRHATPCAAPCRRHLVLSDYREEKNGPVSMEPVIQKGNAVYMENTRFLRQVPPALRTRALWVVTPIL
jgi:hypothetical protein